jgi:hypothetical protein
VGQIARDHGSRLVQEHRLTAAQRKVLGALSRCRTAELGGHLDECDSCGHQRPSYNSCRDRHCPKCQARARHRWLEGRRARVLPTHHFHVVFTLPVELRALVMRNRVTLFNLLFDRATATLLELGRDPKWLGGQLGITAVLHTWARDMSWHPHLHCVVTGGGLGDKGRWKSTPGHFLFPVKVMGALFRGKVIAGLRSAAERDQLDLGRQSSETRDPRAFDQLLDRLAHKAWVVYSKPPFGGAEGVYAYLGRYTHRVAISNARLVEVNDEAVVFRTRDGKTASLAPVAFLRRLLLHVLPARFIRIRHFGLLAPGNVNDRLEQARAELTPTGGPSPPQGSRRPDDASDGLTAKDAFCAMTGIDLRRCPRCRVGSMRRRPLPTTELGKGRVAPRSLAQPRACERSPPGGS